MNDREEKDEAYRQRNHLVAALARLFPSGIRKTDLPGWDPEWNGAVYVDLPVVGGTAQISYHYHDLEAHLFADLPPYTKPYDGHSKDDVHRRLAGLGTNKHHRSHRMKDDDNQKIVAERKKHLAEMNALRCRDLGAIGAIADTNGPTGGR